MATTATMPGIKNSWSLISFARSHGKPFVGNFVNKETGEAFSSMVFVDPNNEDARCFVHFSSKMGELSVEQIAKEKDNLQVVELESGNYSLCKKGENAWSAVDLGI